MDRLEVIKIAISQKTPGLAQITCRFEDKNIFDKFHKQSLKGKQVYLEFKSEKKSKNANSYMWVLCDKIAKKLNLMGQHESKYSIYQKAIEDIGTFEDFPIKNEAKERFIENWKNQGIGWIAREDRVSKYDGYTVIRLFYGSSS